jgi:O-antigen/teichoic acid export membrane protein
VRRAAAGPPGGVAAVAEQGGAGHAAAVLRVFSFDVAAKVLLAGVTLALIRYMEPTEYAHYTLAVAAASFVTQALANTFNRIYIVGYERLGLQGSAAAFLGFQLLVVGLVAVAAMPWHGVLKGLYLPAAALALATCLSEFAKTAFQRELRFTRFAQVELARAALTLGGVAAVLAAAGTHARGWQVVLVQAAALAAVFAATTARHVSGRDVLHPGRAAAIAVSVLRTRYGYLFAYFALIAGLSQLDVFVLSAITTPFQVATYGAAFRYYSLLSLALASVHAVLLPLLQQVRTPGEEDAIMARQWRMLLVFAPVVVAGAVAATWLMPWLDGGRYPGSVPAFQLLAVSAVVSFAFSPHSNVLLRCEDFRYIFWVAAGGLVLHFVLLVAMVRTYGAVGAAAATLITFAIVNTCVVLRARGLRRRWATDFVPPAVGVEPDAA